MKKKNKCKSVIVVKPNHTMVRLEVNKKTIDYFYMLLDERREIRWGKVKKLAINLEKQTHFESPIVINEITSDGKKRIIDGNHRLEAIKIFLDKFPNSKVFVNVAKYKNLTRAQEREIFDTWNGGTTQTATDYLMNYYKTIPHGEQMLRKLPVTLLKNGKGLSIRLLVGSYINVKKQNLFEGGYGCSGQKTVRDFQSIDNNDIKVMEAFIEDMKDVFGEPFRKSKYWRSTPVPAFFRIWYDNKKHINPEKMKKAFKKIYNMWDERFEEDARKGGRTASVSFYKEILAVLKIRCKSYNFKSDTDIISKNLELTEEPKEEPIF